MAQSGCFGPLPSVVSSPLASNSIPIAADKPIKCRTSVKRKRCHRSPSGDNFSQIKLFPDLVPDPEFLPHNLQSSFNIAVGMNHDNPIVHQTTLTCPVSDRSLPISGRKFEWIREVPIKVVCFIWRAWLGKIPTKLALVKRGVSVGDIKCSLCDDWEEDSDHVLVGCEYAKEVLSWIFKWCGVTMPPMRTVVELLDFANNWSNNPSKRRLFLGICYGALWGIWKQRNDRGFNDSKMPPAKCADLIQSTLFLWMKNRKENSNMIVSFRPLETSNPLASKHYIKLTLSNLDSVHLKVTIFGAQAYQISEYLKNNPTVNCVVIVMQFLKLNIWNGIGEAKSHFEVTKLFINSDIFDINEFNKKLKDDNVGISEKSITTLQSYFSSYTDDFKGNFPLKPVCEITEPLKEMKFLLVASIVNIRQNLPWYIIPINVQDCTGTIGLTLFDREAKRLLNTSAYELKKIHEAAGDSDMLFPMQLNVLKNRKFCFLVDITEYNVNNYNNIYTVLKVTEDMSIVSELESKIELMSVQSVSLNQVPLESDDVVQTVQKDVISQTDESFTPSTVDKSTTTSPSKISTI
ncbi:unnamed protein product [Lactuca virosa]|uniref:Reverse transcriptase zinc-binding domain-containing protein n=1 Tax=Lactuca virosa TaxID=75947 RepID=A0AAU9NRY6_9ASTR|nr:unnamed protein product [Lactuca virosa]